MKHVALALAMFLAGPLRAGDRLSRPQAQPRSLRLPVAQLLKTHAPLRADVIALIKAGGAAHAGSPTPAVTEAAKIVRGLLARPETLDAHSAELKLVLGAANLRALRAGAETIQWLRDGAPEVDPTSAEDVAAFAGKLDGLFDGVESAPQVGVSVSAARGAWSGVPRQWRLSRAQKIHRSAPGDEAKALEMLSRSLQDMGLPPYREEVADGRESAPLVAWAGLPSVWKLSIFREGGRQDPGNVLYVLDSSWYIQVPASDGRNHVYVTKGLYFESDGRTPVLVTFKHPRRARYFGNWLTLGSFDTDSGVPLERDLDTPMSSSSRLEKVTNDKLWTRLLLAANGARVPATRAFLLPDHPFIARGGRLPGDARVKAGRLPKGRAAVRRAVVEFLRHYAGEGVVVKPSGPRFHSGEGVGFFARGDVDAITDHVLALSKHAHMDSQGSVLLEQRIEPLPIYFQLDDYSGQGSFVYRDRKKVGVRVLAASKIASAQRHEKKDYNERVWVVRGKDGRPHTVPLTFFRAATWGMPTSAQPKNPQDAAAIVAFETMREAWSAQYGGLMSTPEELDAFMRERDEIGTRALQAIMDNESRLERQDGEPYQAQTDMIGLDLMYQLEGGRLVPYVIEVNDHDAAGQHAVDIFYPDRLGQHTTVWMETMRHRARLDAERNP